MKKSSLPEKLLTLEKELEVNIEQLMSVNEKLKNVNRNLEHKVEKLNNANDDLKNIIKVSEVATLFINRDLRIDFFTSNAADIFNLDSSDKGRPLEHISHRFADADLIDDIGEILDSRNTVKKMVQSDDGRSFIMNLRPYSGSEKSIDGVVLNFVEITRLVQVGKKAERQTEHEEALARLGLYALQKENIQAVIDMALDQICDILAVDHALVLELDENDNTYTLLGCTAEPDQEYSRGRIEIETQWDVAYALQAKEPFVIEDYGQSDRYRIIPLLKNADITTGLYINIGGAKENFGALGIFTSQKRTYEEHEITFVQIIANVLGSVIERKRARDKLKVTNKKLFEQIERNKQYQKEILNVNIVERWNLGEYLHDNLSQTLASAKIMLNDISKRLSQTDTELSDEINEVENIIENGLQGVRNLSHEIVPIDIEEEGVSHAFDRLLRKTEKIHDVNCILEVDAITEKIKNRELATNLYRVVQQAIKNAVVHGMAENIKTVIIEHDKQLYLHIKDDGKRLQYSRQDPNRLGINIMEHRMEILGGTFRIKNLDNAGGYKTCVTCTLPMEALEADL